MKKLMFLICAIVLTACSDSENKEENKEQTLDGVYNNGGSVVQYKENTYFTKHDENEPENTYNDMYIINENGTEKFTDLARGYTDNIYIDENYMYYSDNKNDETYEDYIVKMSLETKEKEYLQEGEIDFVDTENNEIYYTVQSIGEGGRFQSDIYKMDTNGENIVNLATGYYRFIEKVDDVIYLENVKYDTSGKKENSIILSSVNPDGTNLKDVIETTEGAYLTDPEAIEYYNKIYLDYEEECIVDFGVYKDDIYFSFGGYEGTGNYFFGGVVKVGKNGKGFEPVLEDVETFEIVENNLYYNSDYDDKEGIFKLNLDNNKTTYMGDDIQRVVAVDSDYLYIQRYYEEKLDLSKYNIDSGEVTTLFEGDNAPLKNHSDFINYGQVEIVGDYVYFWLNVHGNQELDSWRGHFCYEGYYRVKQDGSELELIYERPSKYCSEREETN